MSRAYRITVKESETRELRGSDEICTRNSNCSKSCRPRRWAELLADELKGRGFAEAEDGTLTRRDGKLTVTVDPCNGEVSVKSEVTESVTDRRPARGVRLRRRGTRIRRAPASVTRAELKKDIDKKAEREGDRLQTEATEALEKPTSPTCNPSCRRS